MKYNKRMVSNTVVVCFDSVFWLEQTGRRMHLVFQPCSVYWKLSNDDSKLTSDKNLILFRI